LELAPCNYIPHARNIISVGPHEAGKLYLAQALGQGACRRLLPTRYVQLSDLLDELKMAQAKGIEAFERVRKHFVERYWVAAMNYRPGDIITNPPSLCPNMNLQSGWNRCPVYGTHISQHIYTVVVPDMFNRIGAGEPSP
jgi:hypothetical protein